MYTVGDQVYFAGAFHIPFLFHHGVYIGNNQVVHFWGTASKKSNAKVRVTSLAEFEKLAHAEGAVVRVLPVQHRLPREETRQRALSRLGTGGYNFVTNNCEHFVTWCVQGVAYSPQVNYQYKRVPRDPRATLQLVREPTAASRLVYAEI